MEDCSERTTRVYVLCDRHICAVSRPCSVVAITDWSRRSNDQKRCAVDRQ